MWKFGANVWQLGGSGDEPQLCVSDTRTAIASKLTIGTLAEFSDRLILKGNVHATAYNS